MNISLCEFRIFTVNDLSIIENFTLKKCQLLITLTRKRFFSRDRDYKCVYILHKLYQTITSNE